MSNDEFYIFPLNQHKHSFVQSGNIHELCRNNRKAQKRANTAIQRVRQEAMTANRQTGGEQGAALAHHRPERGSEETPPLSVSERASVLLTRHNALDERIRAISLQLAGALGKPRANNSPARRQAMGWLRLSKNGTHTQAVCLRAATPLARPSARTNAMFADKRLREAVAIVGC